MLLNVCLLVLRPLFFKKFAGAPYGQKQRWALFKNWLERSATKRKSSVKS